MVIRVREAGDRMKEEDSIRVRGEEVGTIRVAVGGTRGELDQGCGGKEIVGGA